MVLIESLREWDGVFVVSVGNNTGRLRLSDCFPQKSEVRTNLKVVWLSKGLAGPT